MLLANAIADPVKAHVNALRSLDLECVSCEPHSAFVVALDFRSGLRMAEGDEYGARPFRVLAVDEEGSIFGLSGRGDDDV